MQHFPCNRILAKIKKYQYQYQYSSKKISIGHDPLNIKDKWNASLNVCLCWPVLVAPCAHVLHCSEATGDASEAIEVVHDGAACLQVVRVSCGLGGWEGSGEINTTSTCEGRSSGANFQNDTGDYHVMSLWTQDQIIVSRSWYFACCLIPAEIRYQKRTTIQQVKLQKMMHDSGHLPRCWIENICTMWTFW